MHRFFLFVIRIFVKKRKPYICLHIRRINNILKGLSFPVAIYIDTKHYELEQYNGSTTF
jgi:hypothetical protein